MRFEIILLGFALPAAMPAADPANVNVHWDHALRVSKSHPSLLFMATNPLQRRGSPIHDQTFAALRDLGADYVSHLAWYPYPRLAIPALEPPRDGKTSWDFSLIDPLTVDFLEATKGHPVILNFSTIPPWMFKADGVVTYPDDPDQVDWKGFPFLKGIELRDPTLKELGGYYRRIAAWYTKGGFFDEFGKWHQSGHHYKIDYWAVLNEVDLEHQTTPEQYTARYDSIVAAIREINPDARFAGPVLALPTKRPDYFEYFLNPRNHKPGIPIDFLTYHMYVTPAADETFEEKVITSFDQADRLVDCARFIDLIRERLSPQTRTAVNEMGIFWPDDFKQFFPGYHYDPTPREFRNLFAAWWAYMYSELSLIGIDVISESQLVGHPTQFPSVTMIDWQTGRPNATYWVLKMIIDHLKPGSKLLQTEVRTPPQSTSHVHAQGFVNHEGVRKLLLINKRNRASGVTIPEAAGAEVELVDQTTAFGPPKRLTLIDDSLTLQGLGVAILTFKK